MRGNGKRSTIDRSEIGVIAGQMVACGIVSGAKDKAAGVPTSFQVLPYPSWDTEWGTFVTDDQAQADCVAYYAKRRTKLVIDYEHQTTKGVEAPAAGWVPQGGLIAGGKDGLIAEKVDWNARAKAYLEAKEYDFHSPVALYNKKTKRVFAILSIALTNTPATRDQTPLSEQVAAKAIAEYERVMAKGKKNSTKGEEGEAMRNFIDQLRYTFGLKLTDTVKDLKAALAKAVAAIGKLDDSTMLLETKAALTKMAAAVSSLKEDTKLAEAKAPDEGIDEGELAAAFAGVAIATSRQAAESSTLVAAPAICDLLGVAHDADLATASARVLELKHPADMVTREEYEKVVAKLAEKDTEASKGLIEQLIASNRDRITPALEPDVRQWFATYGYESTKTLIAKFAVQKPAKVAGDDTTTTTAVAATMPRTGAQSSTVTIAGRTLQVDADSLKTKAEVEAIQKEDPAKFGDYIAASAELTRRRRQAS